MSILEDVLGDVHEYSRQQAKYKIVYSGTLSISVAKHIALQQSNTHIFISIVLRCF